MSNVPLYIYIPANAFIPPIENDYVPDNDELTSSLNILAQVVHILDIPDASFYRLVHIYRIIHQITDWALDRIHSYSTAITNMVTRDMALSRSLDRLAALEDELKAHMASLEHESQLIAQ